MPRCGSIPPAVLVSVTKRPGLRNFHAACRRETVEYMWDHHRTGYPHTTAEAGYHKHAVACLWLVNLLWLLAPLITVLWAYEQLLLMMNPKGKIK